jgi:hypothetical protein
MSAALQFPALAHAAAAHRKLQLTRRPQPDVMSSASRPHAQHDPAPVNTLAFYRKHTEKLLRRYLYASMLVGRTPSMLTEPLERGWASSRPVESFEDCVIFVLDMEKNVARLCALDRVLLTRIVLQEYTHAETALLLNRSERVICRRIAEAVDHLTEILLETGTLEIPQQHKGGPNLDPDD